jgi:hypothetical protein
MRSPVAQKVLRDKMLEHLEAALAIADELKSGIVGFFVESALDQIRADAWPEFNSRFDGKRKPSGAS